MVGDSKASPVTHPAHKVSTERVDCQASLFLVESICASTYIFYRRPPTHTYCRSMDIRFWSTRSAVHEAGREPRTGSGPSLTSPFPLPSSFGSWPCCLPSGYLAQPNTHILTHQNKSGLCWYSSLALYQIAYQATNICVAYTNLRRIQFDMYHHVATTCERETGCQHRRHVEPHRPVIERVLKSLDR